MFANEFNGTKLNERGRKRNEPLLSHQDVGVLESRCFPTFLVEIIREERLHLVLLGDVTKAHQRQFLLEGNVEETNRLRVACVAIVLIKRQEKGK